MTTDVFSLFDFKSALLTICDSHGVKPVQLDPIGGEHWFSVDVKAFSNGATVQIRINSSVSVATNFAAESGEDSIRGWLTDGAGAPLGNKTQRWVTRQPGWQKRMQDMIDKLFTMANSIGYCHSCNSIEKVFVVKKEGANKGRLFKSCGCDNSFTWLDATEQTGEVQDVPSCPKCGSKMVKRNGRLGGFWGCTKYPNCKGTLNIGQETQTPADRHDRANKLAERVATETKTVAKSFVPSPYQQAIFNHVDSWFNGEPYASNVLVVNALAGSGKTTTGMEVVKRIPRDVKCLQVAFNRHIAKTLQQKLQEANLFNVKASTAHSLGFKAMRAAFKMGADPVDEDKVYKILGMYMDIVENAALISPISNLVSKVKATLSDVQDADLEALASFYGVELNGDREFIFDAVRYVIKRGLEIVDTIDYDDMIFMPVMLDVACDKYDFIFVDEAQDMNAADLELVSRHMHQDTKVMFVGDRYQSMYGFRGANINSIENIIERFSAVELPLSITYRNPKSVVTMVNMEFPEVGLEHADWAIEGEIINIGMNAAVPMMVAGDMALCRTNAPLVKPCFELIRAGKKATIRGRDIGKGLISLLRKMKAADIYDLHYKLSNYRDNEVTKLMMARKGSAAEAVKDRVDTIIAISDGCEAVREVEDKINKIFSDDVDGIIFSSVHRAKGLEADTVYIIMPELMPHPMAIQEWEQQQERNIKYVALTRCMKKLIFVS